MIKLKKTENSSTSIFGSPAPAPAEVQVSVPTSTPVNRLSKTQGISVWDNPSPIQPAPKAQEPLRAQDRVSSKDVLKRETLVPETCDSSLIPPVTPNASDPAPRPVPPASPAGDFLPPPFAPPSLTTPDAVALETPLSKKVLSKAAPVPQSEEDCSPVKPEKPKFKKKALGPPPPGPAPPPPRVVPVKGIDCDVILPGWQTKVPVVDPESTPEPQLDEAIWTIPSKKAPPIQRPIGASRLDVGPSPEVPEDTKSSFTVDTAPETFTPAPMSGDVVRLPPGLLCNQWLGQGFTQHSEMAELNIEVFDDSTLHLEAMVEDIVGNDVFQLKDVPSPEVTKPQPASYDEGSDMRLTAPEFIPGKMWKGRSMSNFVD